MRISAGEFKGRKIGSKKLFSMKAGKDEIRPTSAKVREALFDILRGEVEGASFLDLYAGSGAVGIEAASRGADSVVFVESVRSRAKALNDMLNKIGLAGRAALHCEQAEIFIRRASGCREAFDIIFADPPYASGEIEKILPLIDEYGILTEHGIVLCEHASKVTVPAYAGRLKLKKQYRYGDTGLALYRIEN
jgi:16S rRNA (guanine(966)-N(2))-methyltransferase RsmD